jgi:TPR repeat protein
MATGINGPGASPVYSNRGMTGSPQQIQYATQYATPQAPYGYGQAPPQSPRQFHRPGAPRMDTAQSAWSDPAPAPGPQMDPRPPPVRPGQMGQQPPAGQGQPQQRNYNLDSLPAHPAPVRPGLMQGAQTPQASRPPPVRQYSSPAQQQVQSPPGPANGPTAKPMSAPVTYEEISRLRQAVKTNSSDHKTQLTLAKKLVEASITLADEGGRADVKTRNKNRENYIFEATKMAKKLVSNGYPDAMFYLADCYGTGQLGLAVDPKEAFQLYQQAAKAGHGAAAYRTAVCCEMGNDAGGGTRRDPLKAVQWYRRAATFGDVPAMYKLGMILLKGLLGQQASIGEALIWLQRAAERADEDNPHALHELATLYEMAPPGGKIIRDDAYAFQLFEKAARWGYRLSQCRLGKAYEYGQLGCPIDNRSSIHWYSKAAAQEDHDAELALSGWYLTGSASILDQSDTEAYLWARKAAMAEMPKAEFAMGYFSEVGIGCPRSLEDAKRWYGRAAGKSIPVFSHRWGC